MIKNCCSTWMARIAAAFAVVAMVCESPLHSQSQPIPQLIVPVRVDSGPVVNQQAQRGVIYSAVVRSDGAPWMRLNFSQVELGAAPAGGIETILRVTSLLDGHVQTMNAIHVQQWQYTSAYFNGDAVLLEIIADPGAQPSRIASNMAWIGSGILEEPALATICGSTDDRVLSNDPKTTRLVPIGCTGWLINDANHCLLTAGHCNTSSMQVAEFNVPLSSSGGTIVHPGPQHQYSIDLTSRQSTSGGIGNDWCYFGCFNNSTTGMSAGQAQADWFTLAATAPPVAGQIIRITGHGTDSTPATSNQVQQTSTGPYFSLSTNIIRYRVDTMGGNSGSAVLDDDAGLAIGIHTHGGCTGTGGSNAGTAIHHTNLQAALNNPLGVCIPLPPPNNDCAAAINALTGLTPFTTIAATTDGPDEPAACAFNGSSQIGRDVWFKWLATCTGTATISLCGANYDAKMAIYQGCPISSGETLACDDNFCGSSPQVTFNVNDNTLYRIRIGGFNNATGIGAMVITCAPAATCPADIDRTGSVELNDLLAVIAAWGPCAGCAADVNGSGAVDIDDLLLVINAWGACP